MTYNIIMTDLKPCRVCGIVPDAYAVNRYYIDASGKKKAYYKTTCGSCLYLRDTRKSKTNEEIINKRNQIKNKKIIYKLINDDLKTIYEKYDMKGFKLYLN